MVNISRTSLWACLCLTCITLARAELAMVYSVHHHGVLGQGATTDQPVLLSEGQQQMREAGNGFRARYLDRSTCGSTCVGSATKPTGYGQIGAPGVGFHSGNTLARSSATDQSINSAYSLLSGIFPADATKPATATYQVPPVFMNAAANDFFTLAYDKCPAYDNTLATWYTSDEFRNKELESEAFRMRLKGLMPSMGCNLTNWWSLYQAWQISGGTMAALSQQDQSEMARLADWLEVSRSRSTFAGSTVGGPIVFDLLQNLQARAQGAASNKPQLEVVTVSADHMTILGTLMALALDDDVNATAAMADVSGEANPAPSNWLATGLKTGVAPKVPGFGSLLVWELYTATETGEEMYQRAASKYAIRLVVQDGPNATYTTIPLPCTSEQADAIVGSPGGCMYIPFVHFMLDAANGGMPVTWCKSCNNSGVDVCMQWAQNKDMSGFVELQVRQATQINHLTATVQDQTATITDLQATVDSTQAVRTALAVVLSVLCVALLVLLVWTLLGCYRRRVAQQGPTGWTAYDGTHRTAGGELVTTPKLKRKLDETPANSPRPGMEETEAEAEVIGASSVMVQVHGLANRLSRGGGEGPTRLSRGGGGEAMSNLGIPVARVSRGGGGDVMSNIGVPAARGSRGGGGDFGSHLGMPIARASRGGGGSGGGGEVASNIMGAPIARQSRGGGDGGSAVAPARLSRGGTDGGGMY